MKDSKRKRSLVGYGGAAVLALCMFAFVLLSRTNREAPDLRFLSGIKPQVSEGQYALTAVLTGDGITGANLRHRTSTYKVKGTIREIKKMIDAELPALGYKSSHDLIRASWKSTKEVGGGLYKVPAVEIEVMTFAIFKQDVKASARGPRASFNYRGMLAPPGHVFVEVKEVYKPSVLQRAQEWWNRLAG